MEKKGAKVPKAILWLWALRGLRDRVTVAATHTMSLHRYGRAQVSATVKVCLLSCPCHLGRRSRSPLALGTNPILAYLGCNASQAVGITPAAGVCACGPQNGLIVEDGEGEPAVGDEHCLECVDLPEEGASCNWQHFQPHIKGPFSPRRTAKRGRVMMVLSILTA